MSWIHVGWHRVLVSYQCAWVSWVIRWKNSSSWSYFTWLLSSSFALFVPSTCLDGRFIHLCIPSSWNPNKHIIMPVCLVCACWLLITGHQKANLKCKLLNHHKVIIVLISSNIIGGKHVKSIQVTPKHGHKKTEHHKNGKNIQKPKESNVKQKGLCVVGGSWTDVFFSFLVWARWGCDGAVAVCVPYHCIGGLSSLGWNVVIRRWCCQSSSGEIVVN